MKKIQIETMFHPKKSKKTILMLNTFVILIIALMAVLMGCSSAAETSKGLEFALADDGSGYSVIGIGTCTDTDIIIPQKYRGKLVTGVGDCAFFDCSNLTSIIIPDSVTRIGACAFLDCSGLTSISIPDSVTRIGIGAFWGCSSLTNVVIPNNVTSIGAFTFYDCSSLTSIVIPDSVTEIDSYAFSNCSSLTNVVIPDSVTMICTEAFKNCTGLTSIVIPNSVTSIWNRPFLGCSNLTNITFEGTKSQWICIWWNPMESVTWNYTVYCTDGIITK